MCARDEAKAKEFADKWGYASIETDWRKLIERKDIDAIDICVPNNLHHEIAIAAAKAGKMILCEKPLSMNTAEGAEDGRRRREGRRRQHGLVQLPPRAGRHARQAAHRRRPLGRIFHYRANFLQDWTISADLPQGGAGLWRLDVKAAGSGVTGDLLGPLHRHGPLAQRPDQDVTAMTETFIKERKHTESGKVEPVGIDDACAFLCRFANGSLAIFESTRYARGHKALYTFEINGADASIAWDLHDLHRLSYFDHRDDSIVRGWRSIHVTDGDQPYMGNWWVPGLQIGYEHTFVHHVADFLDGLAKNKPTSPTFREALETQKVCDAVLASAKSGQWVNVEASVDCHCCGERQSPFRKVRDRVDSTHAGNVLYAFIN